MAIGVAHSALRKAMPEQVDPGVMPQAELCVFFNFKKRLRKSIENEFSEIFSEIFHF